ncbi:MAG: glycine C-acetyltransferase, partial [Xanthobacteraceae bacterium]
PAEYEALRQLFDNSSEAFVGDLMFRSFDGINSAVAQAAGETLTNFCSYNYIGMSGDPAVSKAAVDAINTYGTSVSASRVVSGERPIHGELERGLAEWVGAEDSIVFVGGFTSNVDTIGHLFGKDDLIVYDSLIHASAQEGAKLSGALTVPFPHNNMDALDNILRRRRKEARQVLIVVEGIYSMDGDIADLPRLLDIKKRHNALLMVDEAHSIGVLGRSGRGIGEYFGIPGDSVDLWMGTLSKSFASCGGYIAGARDLSQGTHPAVPHAGGGTRPRHRHRPSGLRGDAGDHGRRSARRSAVQGPPPRGYPRAAHRLSGSPGKQGPAALLHQQHPYGRPDPADGRCDGAPFGAALAVLSPVCARRWPAVVSRRPVPGRRDAVSA